jgi:adenylate cyclase
VDGVTGDSASPGQTESEAWRQLLTDGHKPMRIMRRFFRIMPGPPRCKVCSNPFAGPGGKLCKIAGYTPSRKNPNVCARCCENLPEGGATVDVGVLFADIRGATTLGERMPPLQFAGEMSRFYKQTTAVLLNHGAIIDKLTGDGVMALFFLGVAGKEYRKEACLAAVELRERLTKDQRGQPALPVGIGVHVGEAFVGNIGVDTVVDFTALGDTVNTAARLQGLAGGGEVVFSATAFESISSEHPTAEARTVSLRGRQDEIAIRVLPRAVSNPAS